MSPNDWCDAAMADPTGRVASTSNTFKYAEDRLDFDCGNVMSHPHNRKSKNTT